LGAVNPGIAMLAPIRRKSGSAASISAHSAKGAAVVPQDRRPQRLVVGPEQRRAVHLPGDADAAHGPAHVGGNRLDRGGGRVPPRSGSCSDHSGCGRCTVSAARPLRGDGAVLVEHDRLDPRSADVDA
jgi:hypothetical protein